MSGAGLLRADSVRVPLRDRSVHLGVCSPPYFALRSYRDGDEHFGGQIGSEDGPVDFLRALWAVADEMWRVLDDGASWWINLGDKYAGSGGHNNATLAKGKGKGTKAGRATRRDGWDRYNQAADVRSKGLMGLPWRFAMGLLCPDLYRAPFEPATCWHDDGPGPCRTCPPRAFPQWIGRAEVIWLKPNGLPDSVTDRPRRSHEQWFMVTKAPRYFAGIDEIREAHAPKTLTHRGGGQAHGNHRNPDNNFGSDKARIPDPLGKLPGSVWSIPSAPLSVPDLWVSDDGQSWRAFGEPTRNKAKKAEQRRALWELAEKRHADGRPLFVREGIDHFAAFPPEWPRRIIAGWSPSGVCTACGEGRRPVVAKKYEQLRSYAAPEAALNRIGGNSDNNRDDLAKPYGDARIEATITGYACACPDTSAPTRPAVVLDPFSGTGTVPMMARAMGRFGVGVDLSRDYNALARWRIFESGHGEKALAKAAKAPKPGPVPEPEPEEDAAPISALAKLRALRGLPA